MKNRKVVSTYKERMAFKSRVAEMNARHKAFEDSLSWSSVTMLKSMGLM